MRLKAIQSMFVILNRILLKTEKSVLSVVHSEKTLTGTAIIFEMDNLEDTPLFIRANFPYLLLTIKTCLCGNALTLLKLGYKDVFIWSPQGKDREAHQFQNNYQATYAVGKLADLTFEAEYIGELDQGFDFYAPQTFSA